VYRGQANLPSNRNSCNSSTSNAYNSTAGGSDLDTILATTIQGTEDAICLEKTQIDSFRKGTEKLPVYIVFSLTANQKGLELI
jgi:hypothetical protein